MVTLAMPAVSGIVVRCGRAKLYDNLMTMSIGLAPPLVSPVSGGGRLVTQRLSDRLAALLEAQLDGGHLKPGDRLPSEQQLAEAHGVSRTVVREAVHQLKSRGLLVSRQGSGVYVSPPAVNQPLAFDPSVLESVDAVVHVVEVRRVLEGEIAALAAQRASRTQIAGLKRALAEIDRAEADGRDGVAEDLAFHRAIGEATGNPQFSLLLGFFEQYLREAMRITRGNESRRRDFMEQVRNEHRAMVDAISRRDAAAARRCATQHLLHGERRLEQGGVIVREKRTPARKVVRK
jgi:GntR family transcriptional regulator, transcriptional repressor for pyruvate dehydrogenase complex